MGRGSRDFRNTILALFPDNHRMWIVKALSDAQVFDVAGRLAYRLIAGNEYVLHDSETEAGVRDNALEQIRQLDETVPRYPGQRLERGCILVPFIGGQVDALTAASCLKALKQELPSCSIHIACPPLHNPIFNMADAGVETVGYPVPASELDRYAAYTSLEELGTEVDRRGRNNFEIFAECLRTPIVHEPVTLDIPEDLSKQCDLGKSEHPRIGIALTKSAHTRAYPVDLVLELTRALLQREVSVFFFGLGNEINQQLPHSPPVLCNLIDKTPGIEMLAALVKQMDAFVCPDSFHMHLAGVLRVPTLAIFTSSDPTVAGGYPTIQTLTADESCTPCGAAAEKCPLDHPECIVPRHADLHPDRIVDRLLALLPTAQTHAAKAAGQ